MFKIHLAGVKFYAYHGIYQEERIIGGEYEVNACIQYLPKQIPVNNIADALDYTSVYNIIKSRMEIPTLLLETLAEEIAVDILSAFFEVIEVNLEVKKINPPITGFQGSVSVSYELKRYTDKVI